MKYQQLSLSPEDQQLLETRRFSVEEICRWYDVPPVLVHHSNVTTWGSGIEQIMDGFYKLTIRPMLVAIEQAVRRKVLTPAQRASMVCEFALDALLRGSPMQRAEIYSKQVQNGIMTRNECRQLENLPPMKGADDLTAQTNLVPLGKLGAVVETTTNQSSDAEKAVRRLEIKISEQDAVIKAMQSAPKEQPAPVINTTLHLTQGEVKNEFSLPATEIKQDVHHHHSTTIEGDSHTWPVPVVKNEINVEPTPVTLEATIKNEFPQVSEMRIVGMPDRVTTSTVMRNNEGNIIQTTQTESDR